MLEISRASRQGTTMVQEETQLGSNQMNNEIKAIQNKMNKDLHC